MIGTYKPSFYGMDWWLYSYCPVMVLVNSGTTQSNIVIFLEKIIVVSIIWSWTHLFMEWSGQKKCFLLHRVIGLFYFWNRPIKKSVYFLDRISHFHGFTPVLLGLCIFK